MAKLMSREEVEQTLPKKSVIVWPTEFDELIIRVVDGPYRVLFHWKDKKKTLCTEDNGCPLCSAGDVARPHYAFRIVLFPYSGPEEGAVLELSQAGLQALAQAMKTGGLNALYKVSRKGRDMGTRYKVELRREYYEDIDNIKLPDLEKIYGPHYNGGFIE